MSYCSHYSDVDDISKNEYCFSRFQAQYKVLQRFMGPENVPSEPEVFSIYGKVVKDYCSLFNSVVGVGTFL